MPQGLIERGFRGGIGGEAVLEVSKLLRGARVGGDEGQAGDCRGEGGFEQGLRGQDGADGVGVEVQGEVLEGPGG